MCGASREVFLWMWHFGTVGAMTSAMMALPVVALGYRLAVLRRGELGHGAGAGDFGVADVPVDAGRVHRRGLGAGVAVEFPCLVVAIEPLAVRGGRAGAGLAGAVVLDHAVSVPERGGICGDDDGTSGLGRDGVARRAPAAGVPSRSGIPCCCCFGLLGALFAAPREMRRWMLPRVPGARRDRRLEPRAGSRCRSWTAWRFRWRWWR